MAESNSILNIIVRVRDEAAGAMSRLSNDVSDLGGSLNFAGDKAGILAGALAALGSAAYLKNAISEFAEGEAQMARFDAIMRTLPPDLQALKQQVLDTADNAMLKFGFQNEAAAIAMARLLQATHDGSFAFQAFQAAMDLARYKGIGLEEASQALIIAFQGMPKLLRQFGIEVDDHASKETILAAVMKATAGQAEAYAQTTKGAMELIGVVFGEFNKAVGAVFAPAINWAIDAIKNLIEAHGGLKAVIEKLTPVVTGLAVFLGGVFVVGALAGVAALFAMVAVSGTVILAIATLAAVVALFVTLWQNNWEQARAIFELFKMAVVAIWTGMINAIKSAFGAAMGWIRDQLNGVVSFFQSVVGMVTNPIQSAQQGIADTYGKVVGALKGVLGFASGGIVMSPTLAMVGEAGPEAIIPLSRAGGMGGVTVVLNGDFYTTTEVAERFGNELARIIKNQLNLTIRA